MRVPGADARRLAAATLLALAAASAIALLVRAPDHVHLDAGGVVGGLLGEGWSESGRTDLDPDVGALDPSASGLTHFRFRAARPGAEIDLPLAARSGPLHVSVRAMARVRTAVSWHADGQTVGELTFLRGPWATQALEVRPSPDARGGLEATLALRPLPMVRVPDEYVARPEVWIADIDLSSPGGLRFAPRARLLLAAVPLAVFAFALAVGVAPDASLLASLLAAAGVALLVQVAPLAVVVAAPRLLPAALAAGLLTCAALASRTDVARPSVALLSVLVAAGILFHGSLAFVPGFDPYDVEVHVRRARDLGTVPLDYGAILRYGSHLPTETQTFGTATAALGEKTLIPYSPLPYLAYYALHRLGVDLHWGMIVLDAVLAMAVAPWLFVVARRVWTAGGAWIAAILYTLDLPVWHHLGRAHVPASFGAALGTSALLFLAHQADRLDTPRRMAGAGGVLALAVLGYSSLVVLFGLFGIALLALVSVDAAGLTVPARKGLLIALMVGGLLSGAVFYFHYLPGLVHGAGPLQAEPDLFEARTYLIFHNESRQSMRVWAAGFAIPLAAGLLAAPFALRRALPSARPILASWLLAWPMIMLAKEPFLFPRPLRWAKEDQFISPLMGLFVGAVVWSLPRPWMRWGAAALAVGMALWLELGDFRIHVSGLMP